MPSPHSKATIIAMAVIASASATLLHEGVGHGVTAWLRGDIPTELTSNHLSSITPDRLVDAGGTLVNLTVGAAALLATRIPAMRTARHANLHYFLWIFAALNLLPGAGYFLFSGIIGFGDWEAVIHGLPHYIALRIAMVLFGIALYRFTAGLLAIAVRPFTPGRADYNTTSRLPYYAAGIFSCIAGAFDPLGIKLLLISTIPAAFGGSSGLMWADSLMPPTPPTNPLTVKRQPLWWVAAIILGGAYIAILGPGIHFNH